ncbi:hypothetical protein [Sphingomonas sp.]|uniref:hypothetical protein n=1 Tax=Sphingomonas sp. TaxID=28214 RepID=UPI001EB9904F|nr:hypothetical protein [Sphingomonas sp.]MBX3595616.1 hypothetical protein [Sphingomonas sp.]
MNGRLAIQHLHLHWTKAGRGPESGTVRNALRRQFPYRAPFDSDPGWLHRIVARHQGGYVPTEAWHALRDLDPELVPVRTRMHDDRLDIRIVGQGASAYRAGTGGLLARLPFGRRLIVRTNWKWDGGTERLFYEDHYHVGWAAESTLDLPLFREIDARPLLY